MSRLLAEDLLLLCWEDGRGRPAGRCEGALPVGIGGALVVDLVSAGAVTLHDGRLLAGTPIDDDVLAAARAVLVGQPEAPTIDEAVGLLGTDARVASVRDRLVRHGILRRERHRLLGLVPATRHPIDDVVAVEELRAAVRALLTGVDEPDADAAREVLLAGLVEVTGGIDVLVDRSERDTACERAQAFAAGPGVPDAVDAAVREVQAATTAAVAAAAAAVAGSSAEGQAG